MKQPIVNLKDLRVCIEPANVYGNGIDLRDAESVKKFCRAQDGYVKINRIFVPLSELLNDFRELFFQSEEYVHIIASRSPKVKAVGQVVLSRNELGQILVPIQVMQAFELKIVEIEQACVAFDLSFLVVREQREPFKIRHLAEVTELNFMISVFHSAFRKPLTHFDSLSEFGSLDG